MNDFQLLKVGEALFYTPNFAAEVPDSATVTGITFSVEPAASLTLGNQTNDLANSQASIKASGSAHGRSYVLKAAAVLSNGETLVKAIAIKGFNDA
jgi:hypothetical protein